VVGTGGKNHTTGPAVQPNSELRNSATFGVLEVTLHATGYDWHFRPESSAMFTDAGSGACH
jgi:acid phosphatase type 7